MGSYSLLHGIFLIQGFNMGLGNPLQYSCLENLMDRGDWWAIVHGVSRKALDTTARLHFHALEKKMATHSSVLAWRIPGTAEPGGLPSMGLHRVGHNWSDLTAYTTGGFWVTIWVLREANITSYSTNLNNHRHTACTYISSVQSLSRVWLFATPWIRSMSLSITNSRSSLRLMPIALVMPSSHLILCHPLLLLPPVPPSIRVFSSESTIHIRWPKCRSFSFSISPSNEHPGLLSFRMDWWDLLAVQGTLKSLLQHHSSEASIFQCSAFFTVQLSHPYMTTGKTIALTRPAK